MKSLVKQFSIVLALAAALSSASTQDEKGVESPPASLAEADITAIQKRAADIREVLSQIDISVLCPRSAALAKPGTPWRLKNRSPE